jgi:hypothetical protein
MHADTRHHGANTQVLREQSDYVCMVCLEARRDGHRLGVNLGSAETVRSTELSGRKST